MISLTVVVVDLSFPPFFVPFFPLEFVFFSKQNISHAFLVPISHFWSLNLLLFAALSFYPLSPSFLPRFLALDSFTSHKANPPCPYLSSLPPSSTMY